MTKAELIDRIARSRDLAPDVTKKVVAEVLDLAFAELGQYFVRGKLTRSASPRFTFPKFGTFTKKKRSARRGVNPRTLEPMAIEASDTIDFKPSVELKRQMNEAVVASKAGPGKSGAKPKRAAATVVVSKPAPAGPRGPGGRKLVTREEAELEHGGLPTAPLQKVLGRGKAASRDKVSSKPRRSSSRPG